MEKANAQVCVGCLTCYQKQDAEQLLDIEDLVKHPDADKEGEEGGGGGEHRVGSH